MFRLSEKVKKIEDKLNAFITKHKSKFPLYITLGLVIPTINSVLMLLLLIYRC